MRTLRVRSSGLSRKARRLQPKGRNAVVREPAAVVEATLGQGEARWRPLFAPAAEDKLTQALLGVSFTLAVATGLSPREESIFEADLRG